MAQKINVGLLTSTAGRYAKALFQVALETKDHDLIAKELKSLAALYDTNDLFRHTFANHLLTRTQQVMVWQDIAPILKVSKIFTRFVRLLLEAGRFGFLPDIIKVFEHIEAVQSATTPIQVLVATPLSTLQQKHLESILRERYGTQVAATYEVDSGLLGGIILHCGSEMIDASLKGQLSRLAMSLKGEA